MGSRKHSVNAAIKALLTGQAGSHSTPGGIGLSSLLWPGPGRGTSIDTSTAPKITGYAPGMRRDSSVLDPSTGKVLGLGPNTEAPPALSATTRHPVGSGVTLGDLNKAAMAAISAQYDPAIGTVTNQIHHTKHEGRKEKRQIKERGNRAVGDLSILYGKLGRYTRREQGRQNKAYKRDIKNTRQNYRNLARQTASDFDTTAGSTAAELKRLGIDPATALQGAAQDRAFMKAENQRSRATKIQDTRSAKRGTNILMNRLHNDVLGTGLAAVGQSKAQTEAGLQEAARQIADQVFQLRMQRSSLQGQEAGALAGQRANFLQQKYTSKAAKQAARLDNQIKQAQLAKLLGLIPGGGSSTSLPTDPVGKGLAYIESNAAGLPHVAGLENILQYVTGGSGPGQTTLWDNKNYSGPEGIWSHLVKTGQRHNWTQKEMKVLQRAVQIALGI
jgi:hypothetical protein